MYSLYGFIPTHQTTLYRNPTCWFSIRAVFKSTSMNSSARCTWNASQLRKRDCVLPMSQVSSWEPDLKILRCQRTYVELSLKAHSLRGRGNLLATIASWVTPWLLAGNPERKVAKVIPLGLILFPNLVYFSNQLLKMATRRTGEAHINHGQNWRSYNQLTSIMLWMMDPGPFCDI